MCKASSTSLEKFKFDGDLYCELLKKANEMERKRNFRRLSGRKKLKFNKYLKRKKRGNSKFGVDERKIFCS